MQNLILNEHLTRQADIIPIDALNRYEIHVIGCGAIGSFAALALAKMGATRQVLYDFDTVDIVNMNAQFYRFSDIGKPKAQALSSMLKDFADVNVTFHTEAVDEDTVPNMSGIVLMAVDSMQVRSEMYHAIKKRGYNIKYIIDPRMSAEVYAQYTIDPHNEKDQAMYERTLYTDTEAVQERCTAKSTVYTATLAAGYIAKTVKQLITNSQYTRCLQWDIRNNKNQMIEGVSQ